MGLTLIAILTSALLLPGIIAARAFYRAGQTNEIEPTTPALESWLRSSAAVSVG